MTDAIRAEQLDAAADGAFSGKLADPADTLTKRGGKGHVVFEGTAYDRLAWTRRCAERGYTLAAGEGALLLAALTEAENSISAISAELDIVKRQRDEALQMLSFTGESSLWKAAAAANQEVGHLRAERDDAVRDAEFLLENIYEYIGSRNTSCEADQYLMLCGVARAFNEGVTDAGE